MLNPGTLDHILVAVLVTVLPVHGAWEYRRLIRRIEAGVPDALADEYRNTMMMQWALTGLVMALWWRADRSTGLVGLALPGGTQFAAGATVTALGLAFLYVQYRASMRLDANKRTALHAQMESVAHFLPRTAREAALFRRLSITAGVCEEIVYRGYLIWYLAAFVGQWPAAAIAGVAFGLVHVYQGPTGAIKAGLVGLGMAALYVVTGSLLWPMILHGAIDLSGGALARHVLTPPVSDRA